MPGIRVLRYILAINETGHFGKAADCCSVSQSTLSGQLKRFEQYLDVKIFERSKQGAILTEAGAAMMPWIQIMVFAESQLKDVAKDFMSDIGNSV